MTQQVQYVVDLKGAQEAQRELDRLNTAFDKNTSAAMAMDKSIANMERDIKDLNAAIAAGGPNVVQYKRALKDLQQVAAQGAAGTRNMGQAALEASRGLEDLQYGIGGVVNNIPSLVMAFGGGAGLTAAISLGAVAINQLVKHSGDLINQFGEAGRQAKAFTGNVKDMGEGFRVHLNTSLEKTKDLLNDAKIELRDFGKVAREIRITEASLEVDAQQSRLRRAEVFAVQQRERAAQLRADFKTRIMTEGKGEWMMSAMSQFLEADAIAVQLEKRAKALIPAIENQKKELFEIQNINDALKVKEENKKAEDEAEKERARAQKKSIKERIHDEEELTRILMDREAKFHGMFSQPKVQAGIQKQAEDEAEKEIRILMDRDQHISDLASAAYKKEEAERLKIQKEAAKLRETEHKKTLKAMANAEKQFSDYQLATGQMLANQLMSVSADYLDMKLRGEKDAEMKSVAAFLSATGKQLIASGINGVFQGLILSANPLAPGSGAGMVAMGAAAIAAGAGMSGAGSAVSAAIPSETGKSGSPGSRDPGASPRRDTGGGGGGGPVVLNLTYGAAGPLPEDTARLISRELRTGAKRAGR